MKDIIIVEDGRLERERLQKLFEGAGYSVLACESVTAAEVELTHHAFRLAILDIGLGDRSGSYLFGAIKRQKSIPYIIIFTGNPSVHLKQRFLDEGAVDYIVKGSALAHDQAFLARVAEILGEPQGSAVNGIDLQDFLNQYVAEPSRQLFLDMDNTFPACQGCGARRYVVTFSEQTQMPPDINGRVVCAGCGREMDPQIGG